MSFGQLRRSCELVVRELQIPDPFDAKAFCEQLGRERGARSISCRWICRPAGRSAA